LDLQLFHSSFCFEFSSSLHLEWGISSLQQLDMKAKAWATNVGKFETFANVVILMITNFPTFQNLL
jgi:hypothetical protein